jgi:hypothetical protein
MLWIGNRAGYRPRDGTAAFGGSGHTGILHAFRPSMALTADPVQVATISPASFERIRFAQIAAAPGPSRNAVARCCSLTFLPVTG